MGNYSQLIKKNGKSNGNNGKFSHAKTLYEHKRDKLLLKACLDYNPDEDPNGAIGQGLAEAVHKRTGTFDATQLDGNRAYWTIATRIAITNFPELDRRERVGTDEIKKKLGDLRNLGYPINSYSNMNRQELINYFNEIKIDVMKNAETHCPDVLRNVYQSNSKKRLEARLFR